MDIEQFIQQYSIQDIKKLESNDPQFLALQKSRNNLSNNNSDLFLFLVLQCALVSYQISGSGELWRGEVGQKISQDRNISLNLRNNDRSNIQRRYDFLTTSKYNKRIYNIKTNRLKKFDAILNKTKNFGQYHNNMLGLQTLVSQVMKTSKQSKTIVFAIKMFGYATQIITKQNTIYPMNISIPIDSRIKTIYKKQFSNTDHSDNKIQQYFDNLAIKHNMAPLHIDSILWLDFWNQNIK